MSKYRLRFQDGEYGEVVDEYGRQLTPKTIVETLNSYEEKQDYLAKELAETKMKLYAFEMALELGKRNIFLKNNLSEKKEW